MGLTPEQRRVLRAIKQGAARAGASPMEIKAAIETGLVESNLTNPSHGDADSMGWRQERASLYPDPTNLRASVDRFFRETRAVKGKYSRAGDLAAAVQRPAAQYRGRYQQVSDRADKLLGRFGQAAPASGSRTVTTTKRVGQVDNSSARGALIASFLNNGDPSYTTGTKAQGLTAHDPLQFALGIKALKDNPGRLVSETKTTPGKPSPSSQPSSGGKHGPLLELFWQGKHGVDVKNGKLVPQGFVSGHQDHVHVASGPKTIVELGRLAQQMGLHVGENPHFGGVEPVHVQNSYHYRGQAIDVSGDPQKMARYAAAVARKYGIKVK